MTHLRCFPCHGSHFLNLTLDLDLLGKREGEMETLISWLEN